jgi:hypothetical protein
MSVRFISKNNESISMKFGHARSILEVDGRNLNHYNRVHQFSAKDIYRTKTL